MFIPKGPINNMPVLVQIMAWRRPGDKPLSEPMMVSLPTHVCVIRPQWVNLLRPNDNMLNAVLPRNAFVRCLQATFTRSNIDWSWVIVANCLNMHDENASNMLFNLRTRPQYVKHDDVIKWKHFPRYWPLVRGIHRSSVNSPHKGQLRGPLMFSLICAWINGWVNNCEAGDLRRHCAHYDVTVMGVVTGLCKMVVWMTYIGY